MTPAHAKIFDDLKQQLRDLHKLLLDDRIERLPDESLFRIGDVLTVLEVALSFKLYELREGRLLRSNGER